MLEVIDQVARIAWRTRVAYDVARTLFSYQRGNYARAEGHARHGLAAFPVRRPSNAARRYLLNVLLCAALKKQARSEELLHLQRVMLEDSRRDFGVVHKRTLSVQYHLAKTRFEMKDYEGALSLFQDLRVRQRTAYGADSEWVNSTNLWIGHCLYQLDRFDEAYELEALVLDARMRRYGPTHSRTFHATQSLGETAFSMGNWSESRELLERAMRLQEEHQYDVDDSTELHWTLAMLKVE